MKYKSKDFPKYFFFHFFIYENYTLSINFYVKLIDLFSKISKLYRRLNFKRQKALIVLIKTGMDNSYVATHIEVRISHSPQCKSVRLKYENITCPIYVISIWFVQATCFWFKVSFYKCCRHVWILIIWYLYDIFHFYKL